MEEEKGELGETPKRGGEWILDHWGLHPPRLLDDSPPVKVGPWDGIKTTPQHAKRTLVAAGRMPIRGKRIHRLGSKIRIEEGKKKNLARQALWNCPSSETPASASATRMGRESFHRGRKKKIRKKEGKKRISWRGTEASDVGQVCCCCLCCCCSLSRISSQLTHPLAFASPLCQTRLLLNAEFLDR